MESHVVFETSKGSEAIDSGAIYLISLSHNLPSWLWDFIVKVICWSSKLCTVKDIKEEAPKENNVTEEDADV